MRPLRLFRRRTRSPKPKTPPVEKGASLALQGAEATPDAPPKEATPPRRRLRLRLPRLGLAVNWGALGAALGLMAAGVLGTLLQRGALQGTFQTQWPWALVALGAAWALLALARRRVSAFLGAAALVGAGLSLLMDTHGIAPARETLFGVMLVAVGLGIVVQGFVLRQRVR